MKVKMSDLIEEDPQSELRFSKLLERIYTLQVGSVVFEPTLEIDGETHALFANSYLPVLQDRLLRLLWQTDRRGRAESILWLSKPIFDIEKQNHRSEISETSSPPSLFSDLGKAALCSGVIIDHQDFAKSLFSSVGELSQTYSEKTYGADIIKKRNSRKAWRLAGEFPVSSQELLESIGKIQEWQPFIEVALLVTPEMLEGASEEQIAAVLSGFDYLVLKLGDEQTIPDNTAAFRPYLVPMLKYESTNRNGEKILAQQFDQLTREGFINHAYADDHFLDNSPSPEVIREAISISTYPVRPR
jgi:hypothetical protein